jgi:O-antigen/teichoic acid export membrane protein
MRPPITETTRRSLGEPLDRTVVSLIVTTVAMTGLAICFWIAAARLNPAASVGRDGALIAAVMAIAVICDLSTNNFILRFFPQVRLRLARRVWQAYAIGGGAALLGGALFVLIAPWLSSHFDFLRDEIWLILGVPLAAGVWSVFVLQSSVLTALGRARWLPAANGGFALARVLAVVVFGLASLRFGILAGWIVPLLVVIPAVNWLVFTRVVPEAMAHQRTAPGAIEGVGRNRLFSVVRRDSVSTAAAELAAVVLPVLVLATSGAVQSAYFVVPFAVVELLDMLFFALAVSVVAEGARDHSRIPAVTRTAWRRVFTFAIPWAAAIALLAPLLLGAFGHQYAEHSTTPLRLLALASVLRAIVMLFVAALRLQGRRGTLFVLQLLNTVMILAGVALLAPSGGAQGAALGWLAGLAVTAVVCLRPLWRFVHDPQIEPGGSPIDIVSEYEEISRRMTD